uniref:Uncharacterized protein n=1 Tax=Acrobeloides nanus TaxID=290746 RepID=A0A914DZN4_9BILA
SCAKGWSIVSIFCGSIAIILVIILLASKVPLSALDPESQETNSTFFKTISTISIYTEIIEIVITTITSALVLYGIYKIKPNALLPALVFTLVFFIIGIFFDGVEIAKILTNKNFLLIIPFVLVFLLVCYITFLFIRMYYRSYQYLKEVEGRKNNAYLKDFYEYK